MSVRRSRQGEFFGIVGRNGSGKSTLLKCLAGIYELDGGSVDVDGRLSPFIELGVGFNLELTARENVIINAIMLGLTRREARARFDDIIAFAELEEFVDLKLKNYSSGMHVRLAFSRRRSRPTPTSCSSTRCWPSATPRSSRSASTRSRRSRPRAGRSSSSPTTCAPSSASATARCCIERGRVQSIGEPRAIAQAYNELNFGAPRPQRRRSTTAGARRGDPRLLVRDGRRRAVTEIAQGEPLAVCMDVRFHAGGRRAGLSRSTSATCPGTRSSPRPRAGLARLPAA